MTTQDIQVSAVHEKVVLDRFKAVTPNDKQIDLLMRRFAAGSGRANESSHLDPDEISAFAEGGLPEVARAHYVSHLADCDRCRKQVSGLAIAAGAVTRTEQSLVDKAERRKVWQVLAGFFAVPVLRYAAFAAVLLMVAGVAFIALRPRGEQRALVAADSKQPEPVTAVKPATETNGSPNNDATTTRSAAASQSPASSDQNPKRDEGRVAENTTPPLQPMKEIARPAEESEKKAEESTVARKPAYAPAPPGETQGLARPQSGTGGVVTMSDSPKTQADKSTSADRERDMLKDARSDDASRTSNQPAIAMRRAQDEKQKGPSRNMNNVMANAQSTNEARAEPQTGGGVASTEQSPQTRSVGGHKFRRQGNSWIDQKFKSSMTLRNISRGSDEFAALDSGLRSIAQQLGGEVIVVSKGKAYLIK